MIIHDKPPLPAGQPCTLYQDIAEAIARCPLCSDVPTRWKWLAARHKPGVKRLKRWWKAEKTKALAA